MIAPIHQLSRMATKAHSAPDHWSRDASELVNAAAFDLWRMPPLAVADYRNLPDADLDALAEAMLRNLGTVRLDLGEQGHAVVSPSPYCETRTGHTSLFADRTE